MRLVSRRRATFPHAPHLGRYGIAWNAARGTALGHQFLMTCAEFGQPVINLDPIAGGLAAHVAARSDIVPTIDTALGLEACAYSARPARILHRPNILSMSWVRAHQGPMPPDDSQRYG